MRVFLSAYQCFRVFSSAYKCVCVKKTYCKIDDGSILWEKGLHGCTVYMCTVVIISIILHNVDESTGQIP